MIYCSLRNIYLCDLEFFGAEIIVLEERKNGKRIVCASWGERLNFELLVEPCPQGWHVKEEMHGRLEALAAALEDRFEPREAFPYYCFFKMREGLMTVVRLGKIVFFLLTVVWMRKFLTLGLTHYAIMSAIAFLMFVCCFFLPREILKKTYADYLADIERDGGPGPFDFHDLFN